MESFLFYTSWLDAIASLPDADQLAVIRAAAAYAANVGDNPKCPPVAPDSPNNAPALSPLALMAFRFIAQDIDRNNAARLALIEKRRSAGRRGGAPRGNKNAAASAPDNAANNAPLTPDNAPNAPVAPDSPNVGADFISARPTTNPNSSKTSKTNKTSKTSKTSIMRMSVIIYL